MKKSFPTYLIALLIMAGFFAYMIYSQNRGTSENQINNNENNSNANIDTRDWKTYINDEQGFSIKYPGSWRMEKLPSFGVENALAGWSFINEISPTMRYTFILYWENNQGWENCEQFAKYKYEQELDEYLTNNSGASAEDEFAEMIKNNFFPVSNVTINNYSACRLPNIMATDSYEEHYLIIQGGYAYDITFATADSPAENILDPVKNNVLAKAILQTITFSNDTTFESWQKYSNEKMGYAFEYPNEWFNTGENNDVVCMVPGASNCVTDNFSSVDPKKIDGAYSDGFDLIIDSFQISETVSLSEIFAKNGHVSTDFYTYEDNKIEGPQKITVAGKEGIRYTINAVYSTEPCYIEEILIRSGVRVFDIEAIVGAKSYFESYQPYFEKILESIKIL